MKYMHSVQHFFHCSYGKAPVHPLMPKSSFEDTGQNIFLEKGATFIKFSYTFYKVNTPAIHHIMHSSLLSIICVFLACKGGSTV
jgi:hypothetical protein